MAKFSLNTDRKGNQHTICGLHVGDNGIRTFEFSLLENGSPLQLPDDCIATLFAKLKDGVTLFESCELKNGTVYYKLRGGTEASSLTSLPGTVNCEIRITSSEGEIITSPEFSFYIEKPLQNDEAIEAEPSFTALTDALSRLLEAEQKQCAKVYTVPYYSSGSLTEDKKSAIREITEKIKNETESYSLFLSTESAVIPAAIIIATKQTEIIAAVHSNINCKYVIRIDYDGNVTTEQTPLYIYDTEKLENTAAAPTGAVVMQYIQDYVAENGGAVISVNGKAGAVELTAEDVNALPADTVIPTVPENISAFNNDAGYITSIPDFPSSLPNPKALTFTGAVEGSYDGSAPFVVNIPAGGGGESSGGGNVICDTLIDDTLTEAVAKIEHSIPNIADYMTFHIFAHSAPCEDLTANGEGVIDFRGTTIFRGSLIPYSAQLDTVADYGKIAMAVNVVENVITGTSFFRGTTWTTTAIGQPITNTADKIIRLSTWGSRTFGAGTRFVVKGFRKV